MDSTSRQRALLVIVAVVLIMAWWSEQRGLSVLAGRFQLVLLLVVFHGIWQQASWGQDLCEALTRFLRSASVACMLLFTVLHLADLLPVTFETQLGAADLLGLVTVSLLSGREAQRPTTTDAVRQWMQVQKYTGLFALFLWVLVLLLCGRPGSANFWVTRIRNPWDEVPMTLAMACCTLDIYVHYLQTRPPRQTSWVDADAMCVAVAVSCHAAATAAVIAYDQMSNLL